MDNITVTISDDSHIILTKDDSSIAMTPAEFAHVSRKVDTELYYKYDILDYFTEDDDYYNVDAILANVQLLNEIIETYSNYRYNNNGGDCDNNMSWAECLDVTLNEYEYELRKYRLDYENDVINYLNEKAIYDINALVHNETLFRTIVEAYAVCRQNCDVNNDLGILSCLHHALGKFTENLAVYKK